MRKRWLSIAAAGAMLLSAITGCGSTNQTATTAATTAAATTAAQTTTMGSEGDQVSNVAGTETAPKYVFLFIGDGMSYPQVQLTNYYVNTIENSKTEQTTVTVKDTEKTILTSKNGLTMMDFEIAGSAQTYDSTSFAPDSASTATSIATGNKTWSGSINISEDFTTTYETISEKLKAQKDYKIGIISSVNLNHATPAAFYAHQQSRGSYYDIGLELIESGFDYFAGGGLLKPTGAEKNQEDLYELAEKAGYTVVKTYEDAANLKNGDKAIAITGTLADSSSMPYALDTTEEEWTLAEYVEKGIEVLDNDNGFFMMVEGGKIDWACHANDAGSTIADTIALDDAVAEAVEFYNEHPDETLIIVTGDHETGGLTIGYAGTNYDTFLQNLENQKISYAKFDSDYVSAYKEQKTDFDTVMADITELFGLTAPTGENSSETEQKDDANQHPESNEAGTLELTQYEYDLLKAAYDTTMARTGEEEEFSQAEYVAYGSYEPLTVTITHLLNNKSGLNFASYSHTGLPVEVLVKGAGAELFDGYYDNTDIYNKLAELTGVK